MPHRVMKKMFLDYPFIIGTFEDGKTFKYDVVKTYVPQRPEYTRLLNKEFFDTAQLGLIDIVWNDEIDMLCDEIYEIGEELNKNI